MRIENVCRYGGELDSVFKPPSHPLLPGRLGVEWSGARLYAGNLETV